MIRSDRDSLLEELRRSAVGLHSNRFHSVLDVFVSETSVMHKFECLVPSFKKTCDCYHSMFPVTRIT